jgi:RNA methyltransferase, TrmH family
VPRETIGVRNPLVKSLRKAALKGQLTEDGYCVAESFHLLDEALRSDRDVKTIIVAESVRPTVERRVANLKNTRVVTMDDSLFQEVATTETSQGVLSLVQPPKWTLDELFRGKSLVVVLDALQDPGNAGTIVRAAEAFGATGVLCLKGTVSLFNPKALRASAGSIFRVPFVQGLEADLVKATLAQRRVDVYATVPAGGQALQCADLTRRVALLVGSEAHGVRPELRGAALDLHIPTHGVESLNAALATGIVLYETQRQRSAGV